MRQQILLVEDNATTRELYRAVLDATGHAIETCGDVPAALELLERHDYGVVVLDFNLPGQSGLDLLRTIRRRPEAPEVVMVSATSDIDVAVQAMKHGAQDFLSKPVNHGHLVAVIERALRTRQLRHRDAAFERGAAHSARRVGDDEAIVGRSPQILKVLERVEEVAATNVPIVLTGETGTGKGVFAGLIHRSSTRRDGSFLQVNCAALPETLLESELFGYRRGAFTGATDGKAGLFQVASGGTLFLDEITEMSLAAQAKLLQVLDTGEIRPLGATVGRTVDVRVVVATNVDLEKQVETGAFRQDLYFRLAVVQIRLPPLRERIGDVQLLAEHFLRLATPAGQEPRVFAPETLERLKAHDWPGNVREMANVVAAAVLGGRGGQIEPSSLPARFFAPTSLPTTEAEEAGPPASLSQMEHRHIVRTLRYTKGRKAGAARLLGIDVKTLGRKVKAYGVDVDALRAG